VDRGKVAKEREVINSNSLTRRFEELAAELKLVEVSRKTQPMMRGMPDVERVDDGLLLKWSVKVAQLFETLGPATAQYSKQFSTEPKAAISSNIYHMKRQAAIFHAAKEDFEGGHMNSLKNLVSADLFDSQLDQARELLKSGYAVAAAVIAGIVLETTIQRLCDDNGIPRANLSKMNEGLAKAEVYSKLDQKKITAWAAVRNSAAHGGDDQFQATDVPLMIEGVEGFVSARLA
jgi:hypothetical protein